MTADLIKRLHDRADSYMRDAATLTDMDDDSATVYRTIARELRGVATSTAEIAAQFATYEDDGRVVFTSRVWPWVISDGTSHRFKTVTINGHEDDRELTPAEAREFAAAIARAADLAEGKD